MVAQFIHTAKFGLDYFIRFGELKEAWHNIVFILLLFFKEIFKGKTHFSRLGPRIPLRIPIPLILAKCPCLTLLRPVLM